MRAGDSGITASKQREARVGRKGKDCLQRRQQEGLLGGSVMETGLAAAQMSQVHVALDSGSGESLRFLSTFQIFLPTLHFWLLQWG